MKRKYKSTKLPCYVYDVAHLVKSKMILDKDFLRRLPSEVLPEELKDFEELTPRELASRLKLHVLFSLGLKCLNYLIEKELEKEVEEK